MKKLFLLLPALVLALTTSAAVININTSTTDALRVALNSADDGDIIEMAAGTYVESASNFIAFSGKNITVRAADGATVILQPKVPITISGGAKATLKGIKIDASHLHDTNTWYEHFIYATDASDNNRLILEGCELYGYSVGKAIIACRTANKLDSLIINNCKFYNHTTRSCVFLENTANIGLIVTNSTFYNIITSTVDFGAGVIDSRSSTRKVQVDHCTFYNCYVKSTDYGAIKVPTTTDVSVSNCIFMMSESYDGGRAVYNANGIVSNCLTYNYSKDSTPHGIHSGPTISGCLEADPLFTDATNGDFSFSKTSPAYFAGTNWSHLGDPRWFPTEPAGIDLPAASDDAAVTLNNTNIEAKHSAVSCDEDGYYNMTYASDIRWAAWIVNVNPLMYNLSAFVSCTNGWHPDLYLYDLSTGAEIASRGVEYHSTTEGASFNLGEWDLTSVEAGKYLLVVKNNYSGSTLKLKSLTLSYMGGAVQTMPGTTNITDAWFSANGTRADGKISYSSISSGCWAKWNIAVASASTYNVTVNIQNEYGHNYTVEFLKEGEVTPVSVTEGATTYGKDATLYPVELGAIALEAGNYEMKVSNAIGDAALLSVTLAYAGGAVNNIPGTITLTDALLSSKAYIESDMLYFAPHDCGTIPDEWAKWNIHVADANVYQFTANVTSPSGNAQKYQILIEDSNGDEVYRLTQPSNIGSGDQSVITDKMYLVSGDYTLEMRNIHPYSDGHLVSISAAAEPNFATLDENTHESERTWDVSKTTYAVRLIRSLKGGMYNTFCVPFSVSSSQCKAVFGNDVEIYTLGQATVDESGFMLNLTLEPSNDIYQGTPVFIKPSADVVNPVFTDVKFATTSVGTTTKTNANFTGTFTASTIPGNADNLFLAEGNLLYYPTSDIEVLGMRGWLVIHDSPAPAAALHRANIITPAQVTTSIQIVGQDSDNTVQKRIQDGQLLIIRDGIRYNAMGMRIE